MSLETPKYTVGPAPHWRRGSSISRMNYAFILALAPTVLAGAIVHSFGSKAAALTAGSGVFARMINAVAESLGMNTNILWLAGVLGTVAFAMGAGLLIEYVCQVMMRQPYHAVNGHGALMGLIFALLMPPSVPWWVLLFGIIVTIVIGKQIFGGLGGYPMHPAIVGWLVILLSWSHYIYPVGMGSIAAVHPAVVICTGVGGLALVALGYIQWRIPCGVIVGLVVATIIFQSKLTGGPLDQLMTGHVMLAAFFIATDSTSSPANKIPMWLYGFGLGFMIILIRAYGVWPDAVPFAVILMNVLNPLLDRIRPKVKKVVIQNG